LRGRCLFSVGICDSLIFGRKALFHLRQYLEGAYAPSFFLDSISPNLQKYLVMKNYSANNFYFWWGYYFSSSAVGKG
jgi:hypothetical protein